jgi:hypothetical protein
MLQQRVTNARSGAFAPPFAPPLKVKAGINQKKDRGAWFTPKRVGHNKAVARKYDALHAPRWECLPERVGDAIPLHIVGVGAITQDILILDHSAYRQGLVWPDLQGGELARPTVTLEGTVLPANSHPFPSHHPCLLPSFDTPPKGGTGLGYNGFWGGG